MIEAALIGTGLGAAWWGGGRLFHHAILRGLRAPRVPLETPLEAGAPPAGALRRLSLPNPQGKRLGYIKADDRISNCEFGADGHVYMTSNTRLIRAKVKVKKIARNGA